jgi:hypothetical protein
MPKNRTPEEVNSAINAIDHGVRQIWESRNRSRGFGNIDERIAALEEQMDAIASLLNRL